jgi:TctA family transporter
MDFTFLDYMGSAFIQIVSGPHLLYLAIGVMVGLTVGLLPGLGGISGMALVLPFIYGMDPASALAMMVGVAAVTTTSDTFPSVLMGIPGSSGSQATVVDGFPLAKKGEAARALGAAFTASLIGGIFGAIVLSFAFVAARPILLAIGFAEQLMLVVFALTLVGMLTGASMLKGLAACGFGLLVGTVGAATATGQYRMTFDTLYLTDGIPLVIIALGLFAVPEIVDVLRKQGAISEKTSLGKGWMDGVRDVMRNKWLVLRCSALGSVIGAMPGLGGTVIDWLAYGHVVQTSRDKSQFGKGDIRGVIASESANDSKDGGALMPTLALGIPGSPATAVLLAGLILHGTFPGRQLLTEDLDIVFALSGSLIISNFLTSLIGVLSAKWLALITLIDTKVLVPIILVITLLGSFGVRNNRGDVTLALVFGAFGYLMLRFGYSRVPLIIGLILGGLVERSYNTSMQLSGGSYRIFIESPISIALVVIGVVAALVPLIRMRTAARTSPADADVTTSGSSASALIKISKPLYQTCRPSAKMRRPG